MLKGKLTFVGLVVGSLAVFLGTALVCVAVWETLSMWVSSAVTAMVTANWSNPSFPTSEPATLGIIVLAVGAVILFIVYHANGDGIKRFIDALSSSSSDNYFV